MYDDAIVAGVDDCILSNFFIRYALGIFKRVTDYLDFHTASLPAA